MQKLVEDLKKHIPFKDTTDVGDIVLIAAKEPKMLIFAHVLEIERDISRKDEWWHVHLAMLSIPLQRMNWTLRTAQMTGLEVFTMGGEERFIKAVNFKDKEDLPALGKEKKSGTVSSLRRVK